MPLSQLIGKFSLSLLASVQGAFLNRRGALEAEEEVQRGDWLCL